MIFNLLFMEINSALRGVGLTRLTFADNVLSCAVNILGNYLLIEGRWGFPAMGILGAALATVLGNVAACILSFSFAFNRKLFINIPYALHQRYRMTRDSLGEIFTMAKSCLKGVGMMKESMFCSIISFTCVNLGLVALLVLVFHVGIWGVWIGTMASQATQALLLYRYVRKSPAFSDGEKA